MRNSEVTHYFICHVKKGERYENKEEKEIYDSSTTENVINRPSKGDHFTGSHQKIQ